MIKSKFIDTDAAPFPFAAIKDASMRNAVGISHFTPAERTKANAMLYALQTCYRSHASFINWRSGGSVRKCPKFAALKFDAPTVVNRKGLNFLEDAWKVDPALKRVDKRNSRQGVVYRVYF